MDKKHSKILQSPLEEVLPGSMLPYAEYVILDRALPRVEDGLKPVQRRILYTMHELSLTPDKPHKKCARIVGDCMGKYHPHGDRSVYDALVRMAQDFNMRRTLVNGHGNFGSVDGDPAAAMRYTEARLEPLALELLDGLDKNTVDFNLNFDDSLKEPDTLPGRYPNLLVNGSTGIAVGLATNIPPHNLGEVIDGVCAYIDNPRINLADMMKHIKGPDFPTGGYIIANELEQAYQTGRGRITLRAEVRIEGAEGERKNIVISELPYQVNKATLLKKIADLRDLKKDELGGISEIVDESDRNGMRAVIKLKKDADAQAILAILFKNTDLECTFGINMVAIAGGKPKQMGLLEIIAYYVEYQRDVVLRRTKYDLAKARERCHIVEGLIIAVGNIDEVIAIIKTSENVNHARTRLRERFELSEVQAQAILDLRLARLTKLEIERLEQELKELRAQIAALQSIVDSKKVLTQTVRDELSELKKKYKEQRKSAIVDSCDCIALATDDKTPKCPWYIVATRGGRLKRVSEKSFNASLRSGKTAAEGELSSAVIHTFTGKSLLAFTNLGNALRFTAEDLPECRGRDKGAPLIELTAAAGGERVIAIFEADDAANCSLIFITRQGFIKKSAWEQYSISRQNFQAIKLNDGDEVIDISLEEADSTIFFVTKSGMCLNALKDDVPLQGRISAGVRGINLNDGDSVVFAGQIDNEGEIVLVTSGGFFKRVVAGQIEPSVRYRKGLKIVSDDAAVFAAYVKEPYALVVFVEGGEARQIFTEDIPICERTARGKQVLGKGVKITAAFKNTVCEC